MLKGPQISSSIISQGIRTTFTVFFRFSILKILACLTIALPGLLLAQVPPLSASQPAAKVSARAYGAQCTGQGDDTAAIQAALDVQSAFNVAVLKNVNVDVELPQGTCVLSAPLRMGLYGSLVGQNDATTILAHYERWQSKDYAAIDVAITGPIPSGEAVGQRRISNLRLLGANNSKIAHSVGIHIHNTVPKYELQYQVSYFNLADLFISGFDTGIEAEDWESSSIDNVNITAVRQGIFLNGHAVNIQIGHTHLGYSNFAPSHTSTPGATVGLLLAANSKYCTNCTNYPQGISFHDSAVVAFDYLMFVSLAITVDVHDNVLDYAGEGVVNKGAAVQISNVGGGLYIHHNYISLQPGSDAYGIYSTANATDGVWIESNYFTNYAGKNNADIGIAVSGSGATKDWHINANTFMNYREGIHFNQAASYSEVRNNFGLGTSGVLINLAGVPGLAYESMFVDGNTNDASTPVIKQQNAAGVLLGNNSGRAQLTGTFTATGAGCTIAAGAVGNHCTATIPTPFNMFDSDFKVHGCEVSGANGVTTIGGVMTPDSSKSFSVYETALSTTSTGGGTISCEVTH